MKRRVVIIGAGIAGLSVAWALGRRKAGQITLVERETLPCAHASGHNAAIFRPLEANAQLSRLALGSRELFDILSPATSLVDGSGLLLVSERKQALTGILGVARGVGVECRQLSPKVVPAHLPGLAVAESLHGLYTPLGGVIDIHALAACLVSECRALGVTLRTESEVVELNVEQGRVGGVRLGDGSRLAASDLVLAAGAWSSELARTVGCALDLTPVRRHLAVLETERALDAQLPAVWRLGDEVYFRREGTRVLASPCDETPYAAGPAHPDVAKLGALASKLRGFDPVLAEARVARHWACLRTFAPDRRPVIGADPRLEGLFWLGALGGFGMSTGLAAGELLARAMLGAPVPMELSAARLT